jgi:putative nucleotidyltransferase with HDIG domain
MDPEEFLRRFSVAVRSRGLYSPAHPIVKRSTAALIAALPTRATAASALIVGFLDGEVVLNDYRLPKANTNLKALVRDMRGHGIEKITFAPGVQETDVSALLEELTNQDAERPIAERLSGRGVTRIIVGKLALEEGASEPASVVTSSEVYSQAAVVSASLWDQAKAGQEVDAAHARAIVDGLYHVVRQDPASFMAITAITRHDQSIFTHMVNVAGLSMALARSLNLDGALLRELGLAALMHDIGKVNTPAEILNKNDKLTKQEGELLKRHVVDGAHILRRTQDMPALASIVAFEHHLGMDFSGYPENLPPRTLNLCTMIVMVVDAFDALRRERQYRDSLATDAPARRRQTQPRLAAQVCEHDWPVPNRLAGAVEHRGPGGGDEAKPGRPVPATSKIHRRAWQRNRPRECPLQHVGARRQGRIPVSDS